MIKCDTVPTRCYGPNYPDCKINRPLLGPAIHIHGRRYEKKCYICKEIYSYKEPVKKLTSKEKQKIINNTSLGI